MTVPHTLFCTHCGASVSPGMRFCSSCGFGLSSDPITGADQRPEPEDELREALRKATVGEYEVLVELGRGAMGAVYLAYEVAADRHVAIKVIAPHLLQAGEGMEERFRREARTSAKLSHPHIIPIYSVKDSGRPPYFVMKFVAGCTLHALMNRLGAMPIGMVQGIMHQLAGALGYAHRRGVVHRDVKPSNVMVDEEGWVLVTDFGIAKLEEAARLTMSGQAVGTPLYMSPEQFAGKASPQSDQYALGMIAYEMIAGRLPFEADNLLEIAHWHHSGAPPGLAGIRADCPPAVAAAVHRMLQKSPEARFGSMEEAAAAFEARQFPHGDPHWRELAALARKMSNREILERQPPPPESPVPPARARPRAEPEDLTPTRTLGIEPAAADIRAAETLQLRVGWVGADATRIAAPRWESGDPRIATVSHDGEVTGLEPGNTAITAHAEGLSATARIRVSPARVARIIVLPGHADLEEGEVLETTVLLRDALDRPLPLGDFTIVTTVHPPEVAEVSVAGAIAARGAGTATILVRHGDVVGEASVTVRPAAATSLQLLPDKVTLRRAESCRIEAQVSDRAGRLLTGRVVDWRSSDDRVALISSSGIARGMAEGTATLEARVEGVTAHVSVEVLAPPAASRPPKAPPPSPAPAAGEGQAVQPRGPARKWRRWAVLGVVLGVLALLARLARPDSPPQGPAVRGELKTIGTYVTVTSIQLPVGGIDSLWPKFYNREGQFLVGLDAAPSVSTSDSLVATAAIEGINLIVRAHLTGTAAVTIDAGNGARVELKVVVVDGASGAQGEGREASRSAAPASDSTSAATPPAPAATSVRPRSAPPEPAIARRVVASIVLSPDTLFLEVAGSGTLRATLRDTAGQSLADHAVSWSSSDDRIARASGGGHVSAVAPGTAAIVAEAAGQRATAVVVVRPVRPAANPAPASAPPAGAAPAVPAGGQVRVVVRDESGAPLRGAMVDLMGTARTCASRDDGSCLIEKVPEGTYTLRVRLIGFRPQELPGLRITAGASVEQAVTLRYLRLQ